MNLHLPEEPTEGPAPAAHDFILGIQERIRKRMHHRLDPSRSFISEIELRNAWGTFNFRELFPRRTWSDDDIDLIQDRYLKVLSILILVNWPSVCEQEKSGFRLEFIRSLGRSDKCLPFTSQQLCFLGRFETPFLLQQQSFCPVIIEEHERSFVQRIKSDQRLPFTEDSRFVGIGGFGEVREVNIAPRCFRDKASLDNPTVSTYHLGMIFEC